MREQEISEGLGELADVAERDHEVQMARAELYKLAKYAIKLHDMLKGVSEAEGLEGWVQSKITKSADMIGSVYHHMDYDQSPMGEEPVVVGESNNTNKIALIETTDFLAMPDHLVDVYLESLSIEQLEILEEGVLGAIGRGIKGTAKLAAKGAVGGAKLAAKGAVGGAKVAAKGAKLAAKGAKGAVVNKQGNVRLSTAGRADGAEAKLAKIQAKKTSKIDKAAKLKKDQARLAKAKAGIAQAKEKPAPVGEGKYKNDAQRKAVHASKAKKEEMAEGPFKGVGKQLMKRKLNKQYKKSDLANFDDSGIDTSGKTPDEIADMKSDYYHSHMDKADRAKKAKDRLSKKESLQDKLQAKMDEVAGPDKCWPGYKKDGTQKGTGKNKGKRVNKCVKA